MAEYVEITQYIVSVTNLTLNIVSFVVAFHGLCDIMGSDSRMYSMCSYLKERASCKL